MGASIRSALCLQLGSSLTGLVFCVLAVTLIQHTFWAFCLLFGVGLFGLFVATAPLCEHSVQQTLTNPPGAVDGHRLCAAKDALQKVDTACSVKPLLLQMRLGCGAFLELRGLLGKPSWWSSCMLLATCQVPPWWGRCKVSLLSCPRHAETSSV